MSECVVLIASAKIPALNFFRFPMAQIRLSVTTRHPSFTDDSSTAKEQKLTKQFFLPPPHPFSTQSSQYQY